MSFSKGSRRDARARVNRRGVAQILSHIGVLKLNPSALPTGMGRPGPVLDLPIQEFSPLIPRILTSSKWRSRSAGSFLTQGIEQFVLVVAGELASLGGHPKTANDGHLKNGQRITTHPGH